MWKGRKRPADYKRKKKIFFTAQEEGFPMTKHFEQEAYQILQDDVGASAPEYLKSLPILEHEEILRNILDSRRMVR